MEKANVTTTGMTILPLNERHFGRYTLLRTLGSGGMATVYLARYTHNDGFEKLVAIKRIHQHLAEDDEFLKMFADEARLAGRISHPNVAQILEYNSSPSHFIAMEYVDGESLVSLIRRVQPPLTVSARIVAQAAAGLHAAHEIKDRNGAYLNVVHRDVSPHNILMSYDGVVKVVDFGVARARDNLHVTSTGTVKGKFAYMSPEQAQMQSVDRRSDVFSLGIVLYEITTRYRLFKAKGEAATISKVLHGEIVPPSVLVEGYPDQLEDIVLKALSRDPDQRYATAENFQVALEDYVSNNRPRLKPNSLAELMQTTFSDQIDEKRLFLQRCDELIDISEEAEDPESSPSLTLNGATVSVAQLALAAQRQRRRRRIFTIIALFFLLGLSAGGLWFYDQFVAKPNHVESPASPPLVRLEIKTIPKNATLKIDGKKVVNPYFEEFQPKPGSLKLEIEAEGYRSLSRMVSTMRGGYLEIGLNKIVEPAKSQPTKVDNDVNAKKIATNTKKVPKKDKKRLKSPNKKHWKRKKEKKEKKSKSELFDNPYN